MLDTAVGIVGEYKILSGSKYNIQWLAQDSTEFSSNNLIAREKWLTPRDCKVGLHCQVLFALNGTAQGDRQVFNLYFTRNGSRILHGSKSALFVATGNNDENTIAVDWYGKLEKNDVIGVTVEYKEGGNGGVSLLLDVGCRFAVEIFEDPVN